MERAKVDFPEPLLPMTQMRTPTFKQDAEQTLSGYARRHINYSLLA